MRAGVAEVGRVGAGREEAHELLGGGARVGVACARGEDLGHGEAGRRGVAGRVGVAQGEQGGVVDRGEVGGGVVGEAQLLDQAPAHDRVVAVEAEPQGLADHALVVEDVAQGGRELAVFGRATEARAEAGARGLDAGEVEAQGLVRAAAHEGVEAEEGEAQDEELHERFAEDGAPGQCARVSLAGARDGKSLGGGGRGARPGPEIGRGGERSRSAFTAAGGGRTFAGVSLAGLAKATVAIVEGGGYTCPSGHAVSFGEDVAAAVAGTVLYRPGEFAALPVPPGAGVTPKIEVRAETTAAAARRLVEVEGAGEVAALNFASAKNPGGGFLGGAKAQEEDLARCSALYHCLREQRAYYEANRATDSMLYTDHIIWSPRVPFFRDERLELLPRPFHVGIVTAPAPNAGEHLRREPGGQAEIQATLERRAERVLRVLATHRQRTLVLGAWGCGVFRNDPREVAEVFAGLLRSRYARSFARVVFAIHDRSRERATLRAFERVLA